ncbi:MAG: hypothetical protein A2051_06975 [Desulfovibrionales bacterium GWA2_65_9]|nr:MAG: hypothetical protein A2051_06975 [Desulfovibrionales bacterium GWA2_65_9]
MTGTACSSTSLCAFAGAAQVLARLRTLSTHAPQSLVIEGGTEADRKTAALAWAATLNCTGEPATRPCCQCPACMQIARRVSRDLIVVDKQFFEESDSKKSGMDKIRELLPIWGQPPCGAGSRVTIFSEAQDLNHYITNLLLKTLEEPRPGNVFVLLAPQRERLLQTLVSRSFVLTLPWPEPQAPEPDVAEWLAALLSFWDTGQGWFERTGTKGAADRALALRLLSACQRELTLAVAGNTQHSAAARRLARLGPLGLRRFDLVLASAQEALNQPTVMPALVLDWIATAMIAKG